MPSTQIPPPRVCGLLTFALCSLSELPRASPDRRRRGREIERGRALCQPCDCEHPRHPSPSRPRVPAGRDAVGWPGSRIRVGDPDVVTPSSGIFRPLPPALLCLSSHCPILDIASLVSLQEHDVLSPVDFKPIWIGGGVGGYRGPRPGHVVTGICMSLDFFGSLKALIILCTPCSQCVGANLSSLG